MAKQFPKLEDHHQCFIEEQHIFFVGTAAPTGRVNISPKGMDSLRVLAPKRVLWLNVTGSGNETAGHLKRTNRMTLMWCSFALKPQIMRVYGTARTIHRDHEDWAELSGRFPDHPGKRQIFDVSVEMVQTSCGYAVPFMEYVGERDTLNEYFEQGRGSTPEEIWVKQNAKTIDGLPTGTPEGNLNGRG